MSPSVKKQTAFRLEETILEGLRAVKERDGIPVSEQVRRALQAWIADRGVTTTARKRVAPRKRA